MSDDESVVSVEVLRRVLNQALDSLQTGTGGTVELDKDFFWSIPADVAYDVYTQPNPDQLTVGQLSESWNNLVQLGARGEPVPPYALVWIADVLKALGHQAG
ncbi:hypothetical protein SAMN02982929_03163 [Saccharopolyspora kobensis]|uniref:Uncharacterized protein n=1 Tax=Saccharopolyspora kobensis TaxID=146035 RepID=A0A1H6C6D3_9PSEU|nr:hypothetical protein [Saccharopolyspora kobensis]SEG68463.1 hypothetical protein SAMN02982929_03163 [Saccharopolyspora kobensis]SFC29948.1 hypothetical protein SAMN05216506_101403 [Saccharopolyspora kobensis]